MREDNEIRSSRISQSPMAAAVAELAATFRGHRNLRSKLRSRRRPASLRCAEHGPLPPWRLFQNYS
jgi:hypothetical protein